MNRCVTVVGGGLAGTEAAFQLAKRGVPVRLFEMRPAVSTAVHRTSSLGELVCSNSFRSDDPLSAVGLLKREMELWDSLFMRAARATAVPAGGALAVDREAFGQALSQAMNADPYIEIVREEIRQMPDGPCILAAGPLCSDALARDLFRHLGDKALYFYDAIAPVVSVDSLDLNVLFAQSRYEKGTAEDYLNIPLDRQAYLDFHQQLVTAQRIALHPLDDPLFFEGCLPIEVMADRGIDTLRYGPMKPVGLRDPRTGAVPYAVVQLRQDDFAKSLWNMVGFQTQLTWPEQKRVFRSLPGMARAQFVRLGTVHRNTYVNSARHLLPTLQVRERRQWALAGQISGVEGYVESAAAGLMAGLNMSRWMRGMPVVPFPPMTAMGSLAHYISYMGHDRLQPSNINFHLLPGIDTGKTKMRKRQKRHAIVCRALRAMERFATEIEDPLCFAVEPLIAQLPNVDAPTKKSQRFSGDQP